MKINTTLKKANLYLLLLLFGNLFINRVSSQALTTFDPYYTTTYVPVSNTIAYPEPNLSRPPKKSTGIAAPSYTDANFGTLIYRCTGIKRDCPDPGQTYIRHEYSRKQAFNADNSKFIAQATNGYWYLYDAFTFVRLNGGRTSSSGLGAIGQGSANNLVGDCEPTWHPTDPNKLWYTDNYGGLIWYEFDFTTFTRSVLFNLTNKLANLPGFSNAARAWWQGEGRPSNDGRWWGLSVQTNNFNQIGLICYDRVNDTIVGSILTTNKPNNVSTSPSGDYVIPAWSNGTATSMTNAANRPINTADGARAYTRDFSSYVQLSYYGEHSDVATDIYGNDVYVSVNYNGAKMPDVTDGHLYYRRMDNGVAVTLNIDVYDGSPGAAVHVSGTADLRPGWVIVSNYQGGTTQRSQTIMAVELSNLRARRIFRLAHHHSMVNDYWSEPHATTNHDMTAILFASDFGTTDRFESYMIGLPSYAIPTSNAIASPKTNTVPLQIQVYPNPAIGSITISFPQELQGKMSVLTFMTIDGKIISRQQIARTERENMIDISELAMGIYILNIEIGDAIISKRISVIDR